MKPSEELPPIEKASLRDQLFEVRREGFETVELTKVGSLLAFVEQLAPGEIDARRQLEIAVAQAVEDFPKEPKNERKAARLWFGLEADAKGKGKDERERLAAESIFVSPGTFRAHRQKQYMDAISEALLFLANPSDVDPEVDQGQAEYPDSLLDTDESPPNERESLLQPTSNHERVRELEKMILSSRRRTALLGLVAVVGTVILLFNISGKGETGVDPKRKVPPVGTVVDAADGSIVANPFRGKNHHSGYLAEGENFQVCNLSLPKPCRFMPSMPGIVVVEKGDLLWIAFEINEQGEAPLPYATFEVDRAWENQSTASAEMVINWKGVEGPGGQPPVREKLRFSIRGHARYLNLVYVPGSTELRGPSVHDFIAHLPDGIMESGIALADIGAPVSCFKCFPQYKRFVVFKARFEAYEPRDSKD